VAGEAPFTLGDFDPRSGRLNGGSGQKLQPGISGAGEHVTRGGQTVQRPSTVQPQDLVSRSDDPLYALAVGILHRMVNRAIINFPTSTVAGPSHWVVIELSQGGPVSPGYWAYFPFKVRYDYWQGAAVPVIKDPANQPSAPIIASMLNRKAYPELVDYYSAKLLERFRAHGWLPSAELQAELDANVGVVPEDDPFGEREDPDAEPTGAGLPRYKRIGVAPVVE